MTKWRETLILVALGLIVLVLPVPRCSSGGASVAPIDPGAATLDQPAAHAWVATSTG